MTHTITHQLRQSTLNIFLVGVAMLAAIPAHAQGLENPIDAPNLWEFLGKIITSVVYILFPLLVLMLVYTGYLFVAAQGNPAKLQEAKRAFVWTLIGGFVVLGAQALSLAIKTTIESL